MKPGRPPDEIGSRKKTAGSTVVVAAAGLMAD